MSEEAVSFTELAEALFARPDWQRLANCAGADSDLFFTERGEPTEEAKRICFHCVVKTDCLEYALTKFIKIGVWGGRSERERRRMRKERRQALANGKPLPPLRPIDDLVELVARHPRQWAGVRFDGQDVVRIRKPKKRPPAPRRRRAPRFDGRELREAA